MSTEFFSKCIDILSESAPDPMQNITTPKELLQAIIACVDDQASSQGFNPFDEPYEMWEWLDATYKDVVDALEEFDIDEATEQKIFQAVNKHIKQTHSGGSDLDDMPGYKGHRNF